MIRSHAIELTSVGLAHARPNIILGEWGALWGEHAWASCMEYLCCTV